MINEDKSKNNIRAAWTAVLIVVAVGLAAVLAAVVIFSAMQSRHATECAEKGDTAGAVSQYNDMNALGKRLFGKKTEQAMAQQLSAFLDAGNGEQAMPLAEQMKSLFPDFQIKNYLAGFVACGKKELEQGAYQKALDVIAYVQNADANANIAGLQSAAEEALFDLAKAEDFETAGLFIEAFFDCDLGQFVKGLADVSYQGVFGSETLNLSAALGNKLREYRRISNQYVLSSYSGGEALNTFLDYYIKGCDAYGTYSELYVICNETNSLLNSAEQYFDSALNTAGRRSVSHDYAREAYSYAVQAYNLAAAHDATQGGVTDYLSYCSDLVANCKKMMGWEENDVYMSCLNTQKSLLTRRDNLQEKGQRESKNMADFPDETINNALIDILN